MIVFGATMFFFAFVALVLVASGVGTYADEVITLRNPLRKRKEAAAAAKAALYKEATNASKARHRADVARREAIVASIKAARKEQQEALIVTLAKAEWPLAFDHKARQANHTCTIKGARGSEYLWNADLTAEVFKMIDEEIANIK